MISDNIKELRKQKGLTQKELADLLHVTSQAVSRWEMGNVEPSVDTIVSMAKIFEVTTDEIIGGPENKPKTEVITEVKEKIIVEQGKPVLTICSQCKRPIYNKEEIVTKTKYSGRVGVDYYICTDCDEKNKQREYEQAVEYGVKQRNKSFLWGTVIAVCVLIGCIIYATTNFLASYEIATVVILPIGSFAFSSCLFLDNNYIEDMFYAISSWGVVKFPGLIWEFSWDGFKWLIAMKLLFWFVGFVLGLLASLLALAVCLLLSPITYPFALIKSFKNPELSGQL